MSVGWYMTSYTAQADELVPAYDVTPVGAYGGYVWARSRRSAQRVIRQRNLRERIIDAVPCPRPPYERPSELLSRRSPPKLRVLHGAMYLGWIASRAQVTTGTTLIGDRGILHELVHLFSLGHPPKGLKRELIERLRRLELATPGYWSKE